MVAKILGFLIRVCGKDSYSFTQYFSRAENFRKVDIEINA